MSELKPCPFCGGEASHIGEYVNCENKQCCLYICYASVTQWNTRTPQWQPIETAPKDCTHIDIFCRAYGRLTDCHYALDTWWRNTYTSEINGDQLERLDDIEPTHWMPVPTPPKEQP